MSEFEEAKVAADPEVEVSYQRQTAFFVWLSLALALWCLRLWPVVQRVGHYGVFTMRVCPSLHYCCIYRCASEGAWG